LFAADPVRKCKSVRTLTRVKDCPWGFVVPLVIFPLAACSSAASQSGNGAGGDDSGTVGAAEDGHAPAPADAAKDSTGPAGGGAAGALPAGKSGVDAFCGQICNHAQACAVALDAGASAAGGCTSSCQTTNEAAGASPPTELLRADYVAALGACIAASSCNDLSMTEAVCAQNVAHGTGDAGPFEPTQAVAVLCHDIEISPCTASDSGTQDCVSTFMFYSDTTLSAAIACFSSSSCSTVVPCYTAAFTQP
jgi:hypothetical protein